MKPALATFGLVGSPGTPLHYDDEPGTMKGRRTRDCGLEEDLRRLLKLLVDKLFDCLLRGGADDPVDLLAAFEEHERRDAHDSVLHG